MVVKVKTHDEIIATIIFLRNCFGEENMKIREDKRMVKLEFFKN